jgi:hypothetical protein
MINHVFGDGVPVTRWRRFSRGLKRAFTYRAYVSLSSKDSNHG